MSKGETSSVVQDLIISRDPEVVSGAPVFAGTRVPVQALIDYLAAGHSLAEFGEGFPTVEPSQAVELLRRIGELIEAGELNV
ncbi:MAG: DUF433 domain-containing protein [Pyrinomonadaceae bacterium]